MDSKSDPKLIFKKYFPALAVDYSYHLWKTFDFHFKITKSRKTKLGDYKYTYADQSHAITVNGDLNPYSFLVTYLHEVAHLITTKENKKKVLPHGSEWKVNFKNVAIPVLNQDVFPIEVLKELSRYLQNPSASSCSDNELLKILDKYDKIQKKYLEHIAHGAHFSFKGRVFIRLELNRTRFICQALDNGRRYLIAKQAPIDEI